MAYNILILGAAYGSLLGSKILFGGHHVHHVCLPAEADLINAEGFRVKLPVKGRKEPVLLDTRKLPGKVSASGPKEINPKDFDLVGLAMQEPQYRSPGVRELLDAVAKSRVPTMSIMNMPPLPYVKRIPGLDYEALKPAYTDPSVLDNFDPANLTLCSPDPQAIRPPDGQANELLVTLPTNFKVAKFDNEKGNKIVRELEQEIDAIRFDPGDGSKIELPVKLRVHDSLFVPLAKWAMLLTGNYRCVMDQGVRSIADAVHGDAAASQSVYEWVVGLCIALGAERDDMVPYEKYAQAARSLASPSSAARALAAGVPQIERVDRLVQAIAAQHSLANASVDETVARVDDWLVRNRLKG